MFWKKDVLFSKLNSYASAHKKTPPNRVRDVNGFVLGIVYFAIRFYFFLLSIRSAE